MDLKDVKTLVIDDNTTNRLILREMLSRWGAVVTEAAGGEQGLAELLRAQQAAVPYALVLLDSPHARSRRVPGGRANSSASYHGRDDHPDAHFGQPRRGLRPRPRRWGWRRTW